MKNKLIKRFNKIYNTDSGLKTFFSPGRVNLIGEHIDYNGGYVMPAALSYGTYGAASLRNDRKVFIYSEGFSKQPYEFSLDDLSKDRKYKWVDYVKGVFKIILDNDHDIDKGMDIYINSNMPTSAGLSSSSSLELLIVVMLNVFFNLELTKKEMAIVGKDVENKFIGVNSGIMDQFSIITGKKDHAILLNTNNLEYKHIPLMLGDYQLLIINTNKKRGLADSKYNERFNECNEAFRILKPIFKIEDLCSLKPDQLDEVEKYLTKTLFKRVRHVVTEQDRTIKSMKALNDNDIVGFAKLMIASHNSLRDDYDVTGIELDTLVQKTLEAGAVGARMTGAGFGGCTVSIVSKDKVDNLMEQVEKKYTEKIGYKPSFYLVEPSDGTKEI